MRFDGVFDVFQRLGDLVRFQFARLPDGHVELKIVIDHRSAGIRDHDRKLSGASIYLETDCSQFPYSPCATATPSSVTDVDCTDSCRFGLMRIATATSFSAIFRRLGISRGAGD